MLHLNGISKQYGSKVLFEGAEAHLTHRSRVALVGPNGSGKSTLIKILLAKESADSGRVTHASHLAIGHLAQEVPKIAGRTVLAEAMRLDGRREELQAARSELEELFAKGADASQEDLERYGRVLEELDQLDEYRLEARAKEILMGMGFKIADFERQLTEFSGGWLMRVALARILVSEPDLLLLDEPTNHLDLESLLWLEEFLTDYKGALLLVSHDRAFLNRMVNEVWEIDQKRIFTYRGNIDAFATQKAERLMVLRAQHAGQQARIAELERFIERFGAKATKARQAQSRQKELDRIERIELPDEKQSVRFRFPPAPHGGKETVTLKKASFKYGEKTVFKDLDWVIRRGSRVAIVGVNGAGKTTLLRMLSGAIEPASGELKLGHEVRVGYYAQLQAETLRLDRTILDELWDERPDMPMAQVRAIAGAFLFSGDLVEKKIGVLSGGEKARVALAKLLLTPSNFLLLDEPTNHLDVESRGVLLDALQDYEGTLVLVSHDREFVGPLVDSVLEIEPQPGGSRVTPLLGTYDDYLAKKVREMAQSYQASKPSKPKKPVDAADAKPARTAPSNNQKRSWERERDKAEAEITKLEAKRAEVAEKLGDPAVYADKTKAMALIEEQKTVEQQLNERLARWEELCTLLG